MEIMGYVYFLLSTILLAIFIYLSFTSLYLFTIAVACVIKKPRIALQGPNAARIAILVPCYMEDAIVLDTVANLECQEYPKDRYKIYVIADRLKAETLERLRGTSCEIIEVSFAISTKARALHRALNQVPAHLFDIAFILDADNHLASECLQKVNAAFSGGARAVQCHRMAKNENTPLALLDAINEEINNRLLRKGQSALGFSATASGSGMAFEFQLLKDIFNVPDIVRKNGEDKEIDIQLMRRGIKMGYLEDARVLDEKVASFHAFKKQRLRWVESYFNFIFRVFYKDVRMTFVKAEFWNRFCQLSLLPRSLYILTLLCIGLVFALGYHYQFPFYHPSVWLWLPVAGLYFLTLLVCLPAGYANWRTVKSLSLLPLVLFAMILTVMKVKPGRKEFIHTPKSFTESRSQV
jgi:cellulose synthase/poly-beta-1,6-N-acetylglucosamine synthase-like glycosyltransferase